MGELGIMQIVLGHVDIIYILMCNVVTYFAITIIQKFCKKIKLTKWTKRLISAILGAGLGALVVFVFKHSAESVFYSFFIQFLTWDYFFKEIKKKVKSKNKSTEIFE